MSEDRVGKLEELLDSLLDDITHHLWGVSPENYPGGERIPATLEFLHPDGVTDWLMDLPTFAKMREDAENAETIEDELAPELN